MPFSSVNELPDYLKRALPPQAQEMYRHVYNSSYELHDKDAVAAARSAEKAVSLFYEKDRDGIYIHK